VTAGALSPTFVRRNQLLARLAVAVAAVAVVAGGVAFLMWLVAPAAAPPPPRNPFGVGVREAAPTAGGLGGYILALQGQFYRALQAAVAALKENGAAIWSLMAIGFAYGVFHAAGPGHGKAVIAAYLVSDERALAKGFGMSLAAALVQATVAVALVSIVAALLRATAATMSQVTNAVEIVSFAAVAALGAVLVWRKAGKFLAANLAHGHSRAHAHDHSHAHHHGHHACDHTCGHAHMPGPQELDRVKKWRDMAGVVLAAGIRPCAGAIVVLVFALSQGLYAAGIAATFAMALGTALTTGLIAAVAVFAKALAVRLARGRDAGGTRLIAGVELLAAAFVLVLGASLLAGLWTGTTAS
jgi:nickel/cobalt transporter (NicO) family protein